MKQTHPAAVPAKWFKFCIRYNGFLILSITWFPRILSNTFLTLASNL